jgi:cobalt-zinc-cadmium efflux system outer membrane protein
MNELMQKGIRLILRLAAQTFVLTVAASMAAGQQANTDISMVLPRPQTESRSVTLTPLQKLVEEAQQNNPQVLAARRAWQAAAQVSSQVSTLPDPQFTVQDVSAGTPIPFWDSNTVPMTFLGFGISQSIPYPGKLRLRGEVARRQADSLGDKLESVRRQVAEQVKITYYRLSYVQKTLEILERDEALIEQMEKIADARYRVGKGSQQDVLKAQLERTKLLRDTVETRRQQGTLEAQLKTLLNRPPESADIAIETLTETPLPFTSEQLLTLVRNGNPEVSTQQQMVRSKSLGVEIAKKDFLPDFNVQYMWQHTRSPFPDRYSLSFGVKIPIYRARRQNPELAQAAEELNQSRREYEAQVQQAYFEVKDQYLAADTSAKVLKMYREGLIPQATAAFQASLAAYQSGNEDFQSLLASFLDVLNLDKEYWRTLSDHETSLARLERLTGVSLP